MAILRRLCSTLTRGLLGFAFPVLAGACGDSAPDVSAPPTITTAAPAEIRVSYQPVKEALSELLQAAPAASQQPTGPDGGTQVGTKTEVEPADSPPAPPPPKPDQTEPPCPTRRLHAGQVRFQPRLSSPAIEREARAQIYWRLTQSCRGPDGEIPPPDTITLTFNIRDDGSIDPGLVQAVANDQRYEKTAECVIREFSAAAFRGPRATVGTSADVIMTWPSVD